MTIGVALAQQRVVKGGVISKSDNQPVIGATVLLQGNQKVGTITDYDGNFTLKVPEDAKNLVVSYVGYAKKVVAIKDGSLKVYLEQDQKMLEEVVAVGYSKATKRSFTGSAVTVKGAELSKKSVASITQALSGEVPGVNIVNTSGQPGSSPDVYVRGVGSVNSNGRAPLYVVDGVPYMGHLNSINPSDIESTTLLKDAAATSIYGARGANGVVVITTKRGKVGKFSVNASFKQGYNTASLIPRHEVITSPEEFIEMGWAGVRNQNIWSPHRIDDPANPGSQIVLPWSPENIKKWTAESIDVANKNIFSGSGVNPKYNMWNVPAGKTLIDPKTGKIAEGVTRKYTPELWGDEAFQTSLRTEGNIQLAGGNSKLRAFMSLGYLNDKGIIKNSSFQRLTGRMNVNFNPYKWLTTRASLAYNRSESFYSGQAESTSDNVFSYIDNMPTIYPVYLRNDKGEKIPDPYYKDSFRYDYGDGRGYAGGSSNGIADTFYNPKRKVTNTVDFNIGATIKFMKGLSLENTLSGNFVSAQFREKTNAFYGQSSSKGGVLWHKHAYDFSNNLLSLLRYSTRINDHNIEAFVAHEATRFTTNYDAASKKGMVDDYSEEFAMAMKTDFPPGGYTTEYALESYFGQLNYDFSNKYYASLSIRRDGSSKFLNNKWGTFGAGSLAWVVSEEDFLKDNKILNYLKVKASYGTLGQQNGINLYSGYDIYVATPLADEISLKFDHRGNPDLTWERSSMAQIGFEATLFKKLDINVELYHKVSTDFLYNRSVAPSNGYTSYKVNDGAMINQGIDIDLNYRIFKTKDAYLNFKMNAGFLANRVSKIAIEPSTGEPKFLDIDGVYGRQSGRSLFDYYLQEYVGVNKENGQAQWVMYYVDNDANNKFTDGDLAIHSLVKYEHDNPQDMSKVKKTVTEDYDSATKNYVGKSALPVVRGGFTLSGGYKSFELSVQCVYSLGGYGYDNIYANLMNNGQVGNRNWHVDMRNSWKGVGDETDVPRMTNGLDPTVNNLSTRFLTSNSFLNLANVRLAYNLPKGLVSKVNMTNANIWVSGDNLLLLSARKGYNPATSMTGASDELRYAPLSTLSAGISLSF
ncbi:tonB-dependent receptor P39-like [Globicephala melas]|uniref:tonB-dependent receptor P39-like n=1 Tax=Globicephala melas TaxID=9731 RepID=UPI00293D60E0|nr:tonB-dependent receptor P3-like [Globicephala melas]